MELGVASTNSNLYRNNSNASYPYDIASAITITSSSASTSPYSYYYFFYDIEVEAKCLDVSSNFEDINFDKKNLMNIVNVLGKESQKRNHILFYIYDDGTVEKRIVIE